MHVKTIRSGFTREGDDIEIGDNDNRFIIIKRNEIMGLIILLIKQEKRPQKEKNA